jgi:hypothetical protein
MCPTDDTEQYYVELTNVCLYVPLAQLSQNVYNEINALYSSNPKEPQEVTVHFRKQEVKLISIPKGKSEFVTESLFPDSDLPCKLIVCFIPTKNKKGDYHLNPVTFDIFFFTVSIFLLRLHLKYIHTWRRKI